MGEGGSLTRTTLSSLFAPLSRLIRQKKVKRNRDAEIQKVERQKAEGQKAEGQRGTKAESRNIESRNIESRNAEMQSETERLRYSEN